MKYVGGSPANTSIGVSRHGFKAGFFAKVSDGQFGNFVVEYMKKEGVDTSGITRCRYCDQKCKEMTPEYTQMEPGHFAACIHAQELNLKGFDIRE